MGGAAKITSTEVVRQFKVALLEYEAQLRDTLAQLELELRRAVEWVEKDRTRYWTEAVRRASEAMGEARRALERAELSIRAEDKRSCYEQKLAYEQAKRRLRVAEEKTRAVRKWRMAIHREADDFLTQLGRVGNYLDTEFPRAVARLERMAQALAHYTESLPPTDVSGSAAAGRETLPGEPHVEPLTTTNPTATE